MPARRKNRAGPRQRRQPDQRHKGGRGHQSRCRQGDPAQRQLTCRPARSSLCRGAARPGRPETSSLRICQGRAGRVEWSGPEEVPRAPGRGPRSRDELPKAAAWETEVGHVEAETELQQGEKTRKLVSEESCRALGRCAADHRLCRWEAERESQARICSRSWYTCRRQNARRLPCLPWFCTGRRPSPSKGDSEQLWLYLLQPWLWPRPWRGRRRRRKCRLGDAYDRGPCLHEVHQIQTADHEGGEGAVGGDWPSHLGKRRSR